jgi:predicted AAA+ superfamily ATPase
MPFIQRDIKTEFFNCAKSYPIVTLTGPRQSGKTTLAQMCFPQKTYHNLEAPDIRQFAQKDPRAFLEEIKSGAILDEVQRVPELLSYLQADVDRHPEKGRFILTGSHQMALHENISQSLAGRTGILHLLPLSLHELTQAHHQPMAIDTLMFNGGYPRIYQESIEPRRYYRDYVQTYLERDIRQMAHIKDLDQFQQFIQVCASRSGQLIDYTGIGNDLGISRQRITDWISVLKASYLVFSLQPYFENFGKRLIKTSKLYFTDLGLLSYLLGLTEPSQLAHHPLRGALFENQIILELYKLYLNRGEKPQFYFYRDNHQNEIDLLIENGNELLAIEIKASKTFHADFIKPLEQFKQWAAKKNVKAYLIYAGEHEQKVNNVQVLNYQNLSAIF